MKVVVDDENWVWLAWMLEGGCGCSVDGEKLRWKVYKEEVRRRSG